MKKKASKGGNGNGDKRKTSTGAMGLLKMSDHLSGLVQKAEGPEIWQAKCKEQTRLLLGQVQDRIRENESSCGGTLQFKLAQMAREAGAVDDDRALFLLFYAYCQMKDDEVKDIPDHPAMQGKMVELCEGLDRGTKDFTARHGRAWFRCRFASVLRHFGEYGTADLVLNDPETYNRRFKKGAQDLWKKDPTIKLTADFFDAMAF